MTQEILNAALAGVYEHAAQLMLAAGDTGARKLIAAQVNQVIEKILNLETVPDDSN